MKSEKQVLDLNKDVLLFGIWDCSNVVVQDNSIKEYISLEPILTPKSKGRHSKKQFYKNKVSIVERLMNHLYSPGHIGKKHKYTTEHNTGRSSKAFKITLKTLKLIEQQTKKNPLQVLVKAIENSTPVEEVITYQKAGIMARKAVLVSPARRVDLALRMFVQGAYENSFGKKKKAHEALAEEIIKAYKGERCKAIIEKERREKEADGAR
jgi:small subunit ribosomal protein S7